MFPSLSDIAPSDEYDRYIGGVYRLLVSGANYAQVAEHLAELERGAFEYSEATPARNMAAARKLCELDGPPLALTTRPGTAHRHALAPA